MLTIRPTLYNTFICNFCGDEFTLDEANRNKGNPYFCSKQCVLDYDSRTKKEITHES